MVIALRPALCTGVAAGVLAASAVVPVGAPAAPLPMALPMVSVPAVDLAAAMQPLLEPAPAAATANVGGETASPGDLLIYAYNVIQPWVAYGVELFAWAVEWLPWPIGLLAPQADIVYSGWQPFAQSVVYSLAFLVDGQFDLVLPTLVNGIQTGVSTLVQNEIAWILSFFPPLPPFPPLGSAALPAGGRAVTAPRAAATAAPISETVPDIAPDTAPQTPTDPAAADVPQPDRPAPSGRAAAQRSGDRPQRPAATPAPAAAVTAENPDPAPQTTTAEPDAGASPRAGSLGARAVRGDHERSASAARQSR